MSRDYDKDCKFIDNGKYPYIIVPRLKYQFSRTGFEQDWVSYKLTYNEFNSILNNAEKSVKHFRGVKNAKRFAVFF